MAPLPLTYAGLSYFDRTIGLETGVVPVPGVDLNFVAFRSPGDLFRRQAQHAEFEVSEMSLSTFIALVARGDRRFVGIPVFISRNFRHSQVYVPADAGIEHPSHLLGRDVGLFEYQMTAALWIRAFLEHDYGVAAADVHWWQGGLTDTAYEERVYLDMPAEIRIDRISPGRTLEAMLEAGELDALITFQPPQLFGTPTSRVRRMFPDYRSVELEYLLRTRIFPIMHLVVLRRDVYEANRWLAVSLLEAFMQAKAEGTRRLRAITGLAVGLPWLAASLDEVDELFDGDPFPYGVPRNRHVLEAAASYSYEQGLSPRTVMIEELFAPEVLEDPLTI